MGQDILFFDISVENMSKEYETYSNFYIDIYLLTRHFIGDKIVPCMSAYRPSHQIDFN